MQKVHQLSINFKKAFHSRRVLFTVLLIGSVSLLSVFGFAVYSNAKVKNYALSHSSVSKQRCCGEFNDRRMIATYYNTKDNWESELILDNKGPNAINITPILYSLSGEKFIAPNVSVGGQFVTEVDLNAIARTAGPQFSEGSFEFTYTGRSLEVGGGIKIVDRERNLIFDEQLTEPGKKFNSPRLEAVYAIPRRRGLKARMILTNASEQRTVVAGDFDAKLNPHETQIIELKAKQNAGAVSLTYDGVVGTLLAMIHLEDTESGFSAAINFNDPSKAKTNQIHGAGFKLGGALKPSIVIRNIGGEATVVKGRIPYTAQNGEQSKLELPQRVLAPGEVGFLDAPVRWRRINPIAAGLEIEYKGEPGSVIVSAMSVSSDGDQVFILPTKDPQTILGSTGGYPWFVEDDYSTLVFIKNVTDKPQSFTLDLVYPQGRWGSNARTLTPGETCEFDVKQIRDNQVKGSEGNTIPLDAEVGHVSWSAIGGGKKGLIGRSQGVYANKAMSMSYECVICMCQYSQWAAEVWPPVEQQTVVDSGEEGDTLQYRAMQQNVDCMGTPQAWFDVNYDYSNSLSYTSDYTNVAAVDATGGLVTAQSQEGITSINAEWNAFRYDKWSEPPCNETVEPIFRHYNFTKIPNIPHHMEVRDDDIIVVGTCSTGDMLRREVQWRIVNKNNRACGPVSKKEKWPEGITSDCTSPPSVAAFTSCNSFYELPNNIFIDRLQAGCDNIVTSQTCGFIVNPNLWQWCSTGGPDKTIASMHYWIRRNSILIDFIDYWAPGTYFYP